MRHFHILITPLLVSALAWTAVPNATAQANFETLPVPAGTQSSSAVAISGDGLVIVGHTSTTVGSLRACRWVQSGGPTPVYVFEDLGIPGFSRAYAISHDGSTIVGTQGPNALISSGKEAYIWTEGAGFQGLGGLSGGLADGWALDVSDDGGVVVGVAYDRTDSLNSREAFRWTAATGMVGLGVAPGAVSSSAEAVSGDGETVFGQNRMLGTGDIVFRWSLTGGMSTPFNLPENEDYFPTAVNNSASTVLLSNFNPPYQESLRWTEAGGAEILVGPDTGPLGGFFLGALYLADVNTSGRVIVGHEVGTTSSDIPFRWTASDGKRNLYWALIGAGATNLTGVQLLSAQGVSGDGHTIVGQCQPPSSIKLGYVARLDYPTLGTAFCSPVIANSTGLPGSIEAQKSFVASENDIAMAFADLPTGQFGLLLNADQTGTFPVAGGTLCLGGSIGRYNSSVFMVDMDGRAQVQLDLTSTPTPFGQTAILAGDTWHFQGWYRDTGSVPPSNFTNGISVSFY